MNLETKITIYKFTPQVFTLTLKKHLKRIIIGIVRDNGWLTFTPCRKVQEAIPKRGNLPDFSDFR